MVVQISVPYSGSSRSLVVGTRIELSGIVYTARDAVMPKLTNIIQSNALNAFPVNLSGSAIMHTAFSPAGYGPTSSNKEEIEGAMGLLSEAGVRFHLGKGAINQDTIDVISRHDSVFIVVPPVTALLQKRLVSMRIVAFAEEGMEAMHELVVDRIPGIVAAANGESIFSARNRL